MNKKISKKKISLSLAVGLITSSSVLAIAIPSSSLVNNQSKTAHSEVAVKAGSVENQSTFNFQPNGTTSRILEKIAKKVDIDPNKWNPTYVPSKFDNFNAKQWYNNALKDGWRSLVDYQMYLQTCYEQNTKVATNNEFGVTPGELPDTEWIAFHTGAGTGSNVGASGGTAPGTRPVWEGAYRDPWNKGLDNTLNWYMYDGGDKFEFIFDQNNIDNAWERLIFSKRLIKVSKAQVYHEKDSQNTTRNKYIVDGEIMDDLPSGSYNLYYVLYSSDENSFIRDDNGWKVVVTDRNKEQALTKVINPSSNENAQTYADTFSRKNITVAGVTYNINGVSVDYKDYNKNVDFPISDRFEGTKPKDEDEAYYMGKYRIVDKAISGTAEEVKQDPNNGGFQRLLHNNLTFFTYEGFYSDGTSHVQGGGWYASNVYNRWGRNLSRPKWGFNYAQYSWEWVEDGRGGHKIWKNLDGVKKTVLDWKNTHWDQIVAQDNAKDPAERLLTDAEGGKSDFVFFGNLRRVFPVRQWFVEQADYVSYNGL